MLLDAERLYTYHKKKKNNKPIMLYVCVYGKYHLHCKNITE